MTKKGTCYKNFHLLRKLYSIVRKIILEDMIS